MTDRENNQLIADIARDIIVQEEPTELPLFRAISIEYFKRPSEARKNQLGRDEMLGLGTGEVVSLLTPVVLVVMTDVFSFVSNSAKDYIVEITKDVISDRTKKLFKKFRPEGADNANNPPPLTLQQIAHVRNLAYERFLHLKLSEAQASRLADAVAATLVSEEA